MNKALSNLIMSGKLWGESNLFQKQLKHFYKTGNAIGDEGTKMICEVLKTNQAVTELSLWGLSII